MREGKGEVGGYVLALGGWTPLGLGFLIKAQNFLPLRNQQWRGRDRRERKHWYGRGPQERSCGGREVNKHGTGGLHHAFERMDSLGTH